MVNDDIVICAECQEGAPACFCLREMREAELAAELAPFEDDGYWCRDAASDRNW